MVRIFREGENPFEAEQDPITNEEYLEALQLTSNVVPREIFEHIYESRTDSGDSGSEVSSLDENERAMISGIFADIHARRAAAEPFEEQSATALTAVMDHYAVMTENFNRDLQNLPAFADMFETTPVVFPSTPISSNLVTIPFDFAETPDSLYLSPAAIGNEDHGIQFRTWLVVVITLRPRDSAEHAWWLYEGGLQRREAYIIDPDWPGCHLPELAIEVKGWFMNADEIYEAADQRFRQLDLLFTTMGFTFGYPLVKAPLNLNQNSSCAVENFLQ
ncbi:hypothetical protein ASPZODRAFT_165685 [Penicilliopsis zonata CBS 506.65]|uniref:Uncharacterized protein n=1 Tax=Penicilliopsis zonata CBS 506.65 TaxID=1073090 RepID=A0A1L9SJX9_9EURO|nr:hypothetical protein ASPZODRAFT_165685 [Penicilliopsis zonata CBS 506.65]OJJ47542.1 hypothetical protein ASPZODRAFT_165685 [Penicilliopsis zonata CBS 506.65]